MTHQKPNLDAHTRQLEQHQQHAKQKTEMFRKNSRDLEAQLEASTRAREEQVKKELAELKKMTKRTSN